MGSNTSNHSFYLPDSGETGWGSAKNGDWSMLDTHVALRDTLSNRPAAGTADRWFIQVDGDRDLYYDNGTDWVKLSADADSINGYADTDLAALADNETITGVWSFGDSGDYVQIDTSEVKNPSNTHRIHFGGSALSLFGPQIELGDDTQVADDTAFAFGSSDDFTFQYDSSNDELTLVNPVDTVDLLTFGKNGGLTVDSGNFAVPGGEARVGDGTEHVALSYDSTNSLVNVDADDGTSVMRLLRDGTTDVMGDLRDAAQNVIYDSSFGHVPAEQVESSGLEADTVDGNHASELFTRHVQVPMATISDASSSIGQQMRVPTGRTVYVEDIGVQTSSANVPSGLTIDVRDVTNGTDIVSQNTAFNSGTPIASKDGQIDIAVQVSNATGGSVDASGHARIRVE